MRNIIVYEKGNKIPLKRFSNNVNLGIWIQKNNHSIIHMYSTADEEVGDCWVCIIKNKVTNAKEEKEED